MRFSLFFAFLTLEAGIGGVVQASIISDIQQLETLATSALTTALGLFKVGGTCNALNVQYRKEW